MINYSNILISSSTLDQLCHPRKQQGAIAVLTAVMMVVLIGFAALAVDIMYLTVARNELQNAADAAALAGAQFLYKKDSPTATLPNWNYANQKATGAISLNKSTNVTLADGVVTTGYWNVQTPNGLQPVGFSPLTKYDLAAVKVEIGRDDNLNTGQVGLFFAKVLGIDAAPVRAQAVAVVAPPASGSGLFPIAMANCLYQNYWDSSSVPGKPKNDPATGKPYVWQVGSSYHYGTCEEGQWTAFGDSSNNVPTLRNLIDNGSPTPLKIGDPTYIQPGTENTLYSKVDPCSARGNKTCEYVVMPVVNPADLSTKGFTPVVAFACLHILLAEGGSAKYVQVQMTTGCDVKEAGGVGTFFGAVSPPALAE